MSQALSPSSSRSYGLALVCRVWRVARATVYRHRLPPPTQPPDVSAIVASLKAYGTDTLGPPPGPSV